ncbi:hypothetical protein OROGR_023837 [Orobanche gracilis]
MTEKVKYVVFGALLGSAATVAILNFLPRRVGRQCTIFADGLGGNALAWRRMD